MAHCTYQVPDKNISGDNLYADKICNQPFVDWAWYNYNFDYDFWQNGWGYDDCCNSDKPLARTFNAIWALNYSSKDPWDESYDYDNMLYWGGRFVREQIENYKLRAKCGDGSIATVFGAGCIGYRETVKWDCTKYKTERYKDCSDWHWLFGWICYAWTWITHKFCVAWGYVSSWVCTIGVETANVFTQIKRIELYNTAYFYDIDVIERASTLIHECRHIDGRAHNADFPSWAGSSLAGQSGADESWEYNGAYRWEVAWLAWYWHSANNSTPMLKDRARDTANSILGYAFAERPSFTI